MPTQKLEFTGHGGDVLAARLDRPDGPVNVPRLMIERARFNPMKPVPPVMTTFMIKYPGISRWRGRPTGRTRRRW